VTVIETNRDRVVVPRTGNATPNAGQEYEVTAADLPVHCPLPEMSLWNSHPRVYIPLDEVGDTALCPYCGAKFVLK
jgi:uncharacterized Zn-finger protein